MKLDIIVPINNDDKKITKFYEEAKEILKNIKYTFIFIDNNSSDDSLSTLNKLYKSDDDHIKIISLAKKYSKNDLFFIGIKYASHDLVCTIKIDDDLSYISKMHKFLSENKEYDGYCLCNKKYNKKFSRNIIMNVIRKNTNIQYLDELSDIKMFRRNMLPSIVELSNIKGYSNAIFSRIGFNIYYDNSYSKKVDENDLSNYIFKYSQLPLKIVSYFGFLIIFISLIYLIYMCVFSLDKLSLLIFLVIFFSGLIVLFLGLIALYLLRRIDNNNNKIFSIKNFIGFDEKYL